MHNFKLTDIKILATIQAQNLTKIQIAQGYSNCSIAVIEENAVIVTDLKIAKVLSNYAIDVLYLDDLDIKLLDEKGEYSQMKGFLGGAMARVEDKIVVFGDLRKIDKQGKIKDFVKKYELELVDFEGLEIVDYGGIVVL